MNQLTSLLITLEAMKLHVTSKMTSMDDIKILIATDNYRSAAHHLLMNIQKHDFPENDHRSQILKRIHNIVIDKGIAHLREYFDSLFEIIQSNDELKPIFLYHEFKNSGYKLEQPEHYEKFVKMGRKLNTKEFKDKELIIFFCAKILETHDEINKFKSQYL
jgi:hypothetical protein